MNINIDYQSRIPIYEQIENEIIKYISLGILKPNDKLPSIRELAIELGVNANTIRRVYSDLLNSNVIVAISTKGNFVTENVSRVIKLNSKHLIEDINKICQELYKLGLNKEDIIKEIK